MSHSAKKVGENERASVAGALIESLDAEPPLHVEDAWEEVIERRVRELETGTAETVPWSAVRARLFSGFRVILAGSSLAYRGHSIPKRSVGTRTIGNSNETRAFAG